MKIDKLMVSVMTAGLAALVVAGCQSTGSMQVKAMPGAAVTEDGNYLFEATGMSVAQNPDNAHQVAKARLAAAINARAALLEKIKGAQVSSEATVGDLLLKSQEAQSYTHGWLARATVTYERQRPNRLGEVAQPEMIKAKASMTLSADQLHKLKKFVD